MNGLVKLDLIGLDGNAFSLMGAFKKAARRQGWTAEAIDAVIEECKSGDYDHLLCTLMENTTTENEEDEDLDDSPEGRAASRADAYNDRVKCGEV